MQPLFVSCKIALVLATVFFCGISLAQERITKGTKIVLAVNEKSKAVEHIELLVNFQKITKEQLLEKYGWHNFFLGELKGTYLPNKNGILLGNDTTIIMFTDKQFSPPEYFFQSDNLAPGDEFNLAGVKAKVITVKKGELIIKTQ